MNNYPYGQTPQYPQQPKQPFFNNEMLGIVGCALSVLGLCLVMGAAAITFSPTYILALIMCIVSVMCSAAGLVMSIIVGNRNMRAGGSRGSIASWGMILGLVGCTLFLFVIFSTSCMTCYVSKTGMLKWPS